MPNIAFLQHIYYYPTGEQFFIVRPYDDPPYLYWDKGLVTTMTRKEFTSLVINQDIILIGTL